MSMLRSFARAKCAGVGAQLFGSLDSFSFASPASARSEASVAVVVAVVVERGATSGAGLGAIKGVTRPADDGPNPGILRGSTAGCFMIETTCERVQPFQSGCS